jgi:hypothetical protein
MRNSLLTTFLGWRDDKEPQEVVLEQPGAGLLGSKRSSVAKPRASHPGEFQSSKTPE